jgi:hypothetical protein
MEQLKTQLSARTAQERADLARFLIHSLAEQDQAAWEAELREKHPAPDPTAGASQ